MSAEVKEVSSDIKAIGDKIVSLTLLQAKQLADYLKDAYGIEPATGGAVMMAGPAVGADVADEGPRKVSVIIATAGQQKIQVIKVLREITGLGLKEAKAMADSAPATVKENVEMEEAEKIKVQLVEVGATVEFK